MITFSIAHQTADFQLAVTNAVASFEDFDGCPEHDFGTATVMGKTVWFKIDLYDLDYHWGSEDRTNKEQTRRVLTIMFPEDY